MASTSTVVLAFQVLSAVVVHEEEGETLSKVEHPEVWDTT